MKGLWSTLDSTAVPPAAFLAAAALALIVVVGVLVLVRRRRRRAASAAPDLRATATATRVAAETQPAESSYERLRCGLAKTRDGIFAGLGSVLGGRALDSAAVEELETALIRADVGVGTTERLLGAVRARGSDQPVRDKLAAAILAILPAEPAPASAVGPHVVMVIGVNGVGKTTSIGKLAARHAAAGKRVLLVAGDTFRAAAIEQLSVWAERSGAELIRQQQGSDPAAVVFDGIRAAIARHSDVVIVDTAGRLHTKSNLMDELKKVRRVIARELAGAPHETLLVLDATTGQNGLAQARAFVEALPVSGIVLTKLDGTAKGGIVIAIAAELGIPIRYVGIGERVDDLREFDPELFVAALLGTPAASGSLDTQHP
jgi:fused signal recognition particle receptor